MKNIQIIVFYTMLALMMLGSFALGRWTAKNCTDILEHSDTVVIKDTVKIPSVKLQTQMVTQEVVRYKYVAVHLTDTLVERDTVIQVKDDVAVIPITRKTYTDSATYKAVVSGYDPKLEEMEIYQTNTVVTRWKKRRWHVGIGGAAGVSVVTGKPDVTFGLTAGYTF